MFDGNKHSISMYFPQISQETIHSSIDHNGDEIPQVERCQETPRSAACHLASPPKWCNLSHRYGMRIVQIRIDVNQSVLYMCICVYVYTCICVYVYVCICVYIFI